MWANVLCGLLCCQGAACTAPAPAPVPLTDAPGPHELLLEGVQVERWVDGQLRLSSHAERAAVDRRGGTVRATGVELTARGPDGVERGRVSGRTLTGDLKGEVAVLTGDVTLRDTTGRTLTATQASYTGRDQRVRAPGRVRLEGANFWAEGRGLDADLETGTIDVAGPLQGRVGGDRAATGP